MPSRNGAAIVVFPGRSKPVPHAQMLVRHGYGVLLLDRRGEGAGEGDFNAVYAARGGRSVERWKVPEGAIPAQSPQRPSSTIGAWSASSTARC